MLSLWEWCDGVSNLLPVAGCGPKVSLIFDALGAVKLPSAYAVLVLRGNEVLCSLMRTAIELCWKLLIGGAFLSPGWRAVPEHISEHYEVKTRDFEPRREECVSITAPPRQKRHRAGTGF